MTGGKRHRRDDDIPQRIAGHDANAPEVTSRGSMPFDKSLAGSLIVPGHGLAVEEQVRVCCSGAQLL